LQTSDQNNKRMAIGDAEMIETLTGSGDNDSITSTQISFASTPEVTEIGCTSSPINEHTSSGSRKQSSVKSNNMKVNQPINPIFVIDKK